VRRQQQGGGGECWGAKEAFLSEKSLFVDLRKESLVAACEEQLAAVCVWGGPKEWLPGGR